MNLKEIIQHRRSIYPDLFVNKEVSDGDIQTLIDSANWAPSHKKTNPWRFKVLKGGALERVGLFLANCYKDHTEDTKFSQFKFDKIQKKATNSGAIIVIFMERDPKERIPEWEEVAATAMAVQNLWLQATDLGLGGYWSSPSFISEMHHFFQFPEGDLTCLGLFYLGHYDASLHPKVAMKTVGETVWFTE